MFHHYDASYLQSRKECCKDVDLYGLLAGRLGLSYTLPEVCQ